MCLSLSGSYNSFFFRFLCMNFYSSCIIKEKKMIHCFRLIFQLEVHNEVRKKKETKVDRIF